MRMKRKISRNEKHKYSNVEKLALGEYENTSDLTNIGTRKTTTRKIPTRMIPPG